MASNSHRGVWNNPVLPPISISSPPQYSTQAGCSALGCGSWDELLGSWGPLQRWSGLALQRPTAGLCCAKDESLGATKEFYSQCKQTGRAQLAATGTAGRSGEITVAGRNHP